MADDECSIKGCHNDGKPIDLGVMFPDARLCKMHREALKARFSKE